MLHRTTLNAAQSARPTTPPPVGAPPPTPPLSAACSRLDSYTFSSTSVGSAAFTSKYSPSVGVLQRGKEEKGVKGEGEQPKSLEHALVTSWHHSAASPTCRGATRQALQSRWRRGAPSAAGQAQQAADSE